MLQKCVALLTLVFTVGFAVANDADKTCDNQGTCFPRPPDDAKYASDCYFPSNYFLEVPVLMIKDETRNSKVITFGLPSGRTLNHPISSAILMNVPKADGSFAVRPYNPISSKDGSFELLIKIYPDGIAGTYVSQLKVGDLVAFRQIKGNIKPFRFPFDGIQKITMIAGGTGIAPMYQALVPILEHSTQEVRLLYGNKTPDDIMLRTELDALAAKYPSRFEVYYVIGDEEFDSRHEASGYETGWVDAAKIQRLGFPPADSVAWLCGVDDMYTSLAGSRMKPLTEDSALYKLGFTDANVWRS
jgi:cytochrome-b5 reductase